MAAHVHSDENNVIQLIYDAPDDIMSIINYHPGDPLYERGIAGQMLLNLFELDSEGKPVIVQKVVELPILISKERDQLNGPNLENPNL